MKWLKEPSVYAVILIVAIAWGFWHFFWDVPTYRMEVRVSSKAVGQGFIQTVNQSRILLKLYPDLPSTFKSTMTMNIPEEKVEGDGIAPGKMRVMAYRSLSVELPIRLYNTGSEEKIFELTLAPPKERTYRDLAPDTSKLLIDQYMECQKGIPEAERRLLTAKTAFEKRELRALIARYQETSKEIMATYGMDYKTPIKDATTGEIYTPLPSTALGWFSPVAMQVTVPANSSVEVKFLLTIPERETMMRDMQVVR